MVDSLKRAKQHLVSVATKICRQQYYKENIDPEYDNGSWCTYNNAMAIIYDELAMIQKEIDAINKTNGTPVPHWPIGPIEEHVIDLSHLK